MWPRSGDDEHESSSDALVWRGAPGSTSASPPPNDTSRFDGFDDFDGDVDDPFGDDFDDEPLRRRSGLRAMAVLGVVGFVFAATIVTGLGGADAPPPAPSPAPVTTPAPPTTVAADGPVDEAGGLTAGAGRDDPPVSERPDVDLGLSYGGAGGGSDIRATQRISPLAATPLVDPGVLPRLPPRIDTVAWATTIPVVDLLVAGGDDGDDSDAIAADRVDVVVVDDIIVVTVRDADDQVAFVVLDATDGTRLAVDSSDEVESVFASIDAQAARRAVPSTDIAAEVISARGVTASPVADELTQRAIEQVDEGEASVLAAEEVAQGRAVAFIGDRLVGLRAAAGDGVTTADGSPLVADWTRVGVLVGVAASDRGALLLVSDLRGRQQITIDAATGETVTELSALAWSEVYATAANGVVVRRPAAIGSVIEAVDLDGRELWRLLESPAWSIGDGIIVTASLDASGVTVEARR